LSLLQIEEVKPCEFYGIFASYDCPSFLLLASLLYSKGDLLLVGKGLV